jgi:hypothetical protein
MLSGKSNNESIELSDLKAIRVAFPKYLERKPYFRSAKIVANDQSYQLELAQNINEIAFKTLEDRMLREFGNSLLRFALKQTAEHVVRKKDETLGTLLSFANALTEKTDTRNWQTLPYDIFYCRIPLPQGQNKLVLKTYSSDKNSGSSTEFNFDVKGGETLFHLYHSLESLPLEQ